MIKQRQVENRLQDIIAQGSPPDVVKEAQDPFNTWMLVGTYKHADV